MEAVSFSETFYLYSILHDFIPQNTGIFNNIAVRTSNIAQFLLPLQQELAQNGD
jgi:hypothetical protein